MDKNSGAVVGLGAILAVATVAIIANSSKAQAGTGTGSLYGKVTDSITGGALPDVSVQVGDGQPMLTANDGSYGFTDIPVGTYTVIFSKTGYVSKEV